MSKITLNKIPYWDGKAENFRLYISMIKGHVKFIGIGDALDLVLIENCPT
jgi:hypothetical protein